MNDSYHVNSKVLTIDDVLYRQLPIGSFAFRSCYIGNDLKELFNRKKEKCIPEELVSIKFELSCFEGSKNIGKYLLLYDLIKEEGLINLNDELIRNSLLGREIYIEYVYSGKKVVDTITGWNHNSRGYYMTTANGNKLTSKKLFEWRFHDTKERIASIFLIEV